jgi:pimeloyl-ACP methyl ester carboxylesterase
MPVLTSKRGKTCCGYKKKGCTHIKVPVLMLHGDFDPPHPGRLIRTSLESYMPQVEYREFESCGHYPWLEKSASEEFFSVLRNWLEYYLDKSQRTGVE